MKYSNVRELRKTVLTNQYFIIDFLLNDYLLCTKVCLYMIIIKWLSIVTNRVLSINQWLATSCIIQKKYNK